MLKVMAMFSLPAKIKFHVFQLLFLGTKSRKHKCVTISLAKGAKFSYLATGMKVFVICFAIEELQLNSSFWQAHAIPLVTSPALNESSLKELTAIYARWS